MLTDTQVQALRPRGKDYTVSDDNGQRGTGRLLLRVRPNGSKGWLYTYYEDGRKCRMSLGSYPTTSLKAARARAVDQAALLQDGINPKDAREQAVVKRKAQAARGTLGDLLDVYLQRMTTDGMRTVDSVKSSLDRYVRKPFPKLVATAAVDIQPGDISDILKRMIDAGVTTHSNRVRTYLHAAFQHGLKAEHDPRRRSGVRFGLSSNPVAAIPVQKDYERTSDRVLSPDELRTVFDALDNGVNKDGKQVAVASPIVRGLIKLALLTGQRGSELRRLTWRDVDFDNSVMTIPATVSKNKRTHMVPLCSMALAVVTDLQEFSGEQEYVFASKRGNQWTGSEITGEALAKAMRGAYGLVKIDRFDTRDMRRTWKTIGGQAGIDKDIRDRIQNHALHDVSSKHYDRHSYLDEKREALAKYERHLSKVLSGNKAKVVQLHG